MLSTRHISKSRTQCMLPALLLLLISVGLAFALPSVRALAADAGSTLLGILVIDSVKEPGALDTGTTKLNMRVTNSATYTLTLDNNDGTGPGETVAVPYYHTPQSVTPPDRTGYTFQGYYDDPVNGTQYYNADGTGVHVWDKNSDDILYAHWALQIKCTFPSDALIKVDAAGRVTGEELSFASSTVEDIKVTAVKGMRDAKASSLFANQTTLDGARILLTPPSSVGPEAKVPLTVAETSVSTSWTIGANSSLSVAFGLSLPNGAQLNYLANDGQVSIASLSYEVSAASASQS